VVGAEVVVDMAVGKEVEEETEGAVAKVVEVVEEVELKAN